MVGILQIGHEGHRGWCRLLGCLLLLLLLLLLCLLLSGDEVAIRRVVFVHRLKQLAVKQHVCRGANLVHRAL